MSRLFCVGLLAPQTVDITVKRLKDSFASQGNIPAPLASIVPLVYSVEKPPPPVPGHLPACHQPILLGTSLKLTSDGRWVMWPVDTGHWFLQLQKAISAESDNDVPHHLFPLGQGLPIAWNKPNGVKNEEMSVKIPSQTPHWRAVNLACYSIIFNPERSWFLSLYWKEVWKRRLRRAPADKRDQGERNHCV